MSERRQGTRRLYRARPEGLAELHKGLSRRLLEEASSASKPEVQQEKRSGRAARAAGRNSLIEREVRVRGGARDGLLLLHRPGEDGPLDGGRSDARPTPRRRLLLTNTPRLVIVGEFVTVEPYRRIVFTWGYGRFPEEEANPLPPGTSTVEVELVPDGEATIVRLRHRVPTELAVFQRLGWEHYLPRLRPRPWAAIRARTRSSTCSRTCCRRRSERRQDRVGSGSP